MATTVTARTRATRTRATRTRAPRAIGPDTEEVAERKRLVRRLIGDRGFAEEQGFAVTNNPGGLFQLLYLSLLLRRTRDHSRAVRSAQALRDRGCSSAALMAAAAPELRLEAVRTGGRRRDEAELVATLGELATVVVRRYQGDLRRLRTRARQSADRERALLTELPGVDDETVDLFFREVQAVWREVAPFADRRALVAARRLGLGRSAAELQSLAGSAESERMAWLVGGLARMAMENKYL